MLGIWILELPRGTSKMNLGCMVFFGVSGLLEDHQDMHLLSLMMTEMQWMQFVPWMVKMVGVWSFPITRKVVVVVVADVDVVEVRT